MGKPTCSFPCLTHMVSGCQAFKTDTSMEPPNLRVWSCLITLVKWDAQPPMSPNVLPLVPVQTPCRGRGSQGWTLPLTRASFPHSDDLLSPKVVPQEASEDTRTSLPLTVTTCVPWWGGTMRKDSMQRKGTVGPTFTQAEPRGRVHGRPFELSFFLPLPSLSPSLPLSFISPAFPSFFPLSLFIMRSMWLSSKESACYGMRRGLDPWVGKISWGRARPPTPVFLPGGSHGQRSLGA